MTTDEELVAVVAEIKKTEWDRNCAVNPETYAELDEQLPTLRRRRFALEVKRALEDLATPAPDPWMERFNLWAHLCARHAGIFSPEGDLERQHNHEHEGPGTIRGHDPGDRNYSLRELGKVLSEAER